MFRGFRTRLTDFARAASAIRACFRRKGHIIRSGYRKTFCAKVLLKDSTDSTMKQRRFRFILLLILELSSAREGNTWCTNALKIHSVPKPSGCAGVPIENGTDGGHLNLPEFENWYKTNTLNRIEESRNWL